MSRSSARRRRYTRLAVLITALVVAAVAITLNSLLPQPLVPAVTWERLAGWSGLNRTRSIPDGEFQIHFIDVGNADAALLQTGDCHWLIDGGEPADGPVVVDYLRSQGVERLDYVVATHPDTDHIGGLPDVLEAFPVDHVLMTYMDGEDTPTSYTYERLLSTLLQQDIPVTEAKPGQQYALGEGVVDILGPTHTYSESNNMSVVCRITFGNRRFLMMGDAETKAETDLMESGADLSADVLKVGHHGSHSSTGTAFLKAVSPSHAVISCGAGNRYGHPHPETLDVLQQQGVHVWRTDVYGHIVMTTDGTELTVAVEKPEEAAA